MSVSAEADRVAVAHQDSVLGIARATVEGVGAAWDQYGGLTDDEATRFVEVAAPVVETAQQQTVALGAAYVDAYVATVDPALAQVSDLAPAELVAELRGGVEPADVYRRPVVEARIAIANGATYADALRRGRARAVQTADTDIMLASRAGTSAAMRGYEQIVGYRRKTDGAACTFCLLASTQRYNVRDLMPMHPSCHCTVQPIVGTKDPGQIIDQELLDIVRARDPLAGTRGNARKLARQAAGLTKVEDHPELGPVLKPNPEALHRSATDWAAWATDQGWTVNSVSPDRIEAERNGRKIAWIPTQDGATWRIARGG